MKDSAACSQAGQGLCANLDCPRWSVAAGLWADRKADDCGYVESLTWAELQAAVKPKSGNE